MPRANANPAHAAVDRELGARIRQRREALGLSQTWLGEQIGLSFQQVQKYERGRNRVSASTLVAIAGALSTSSAALLAGLGGDDEWPPSLAWAASANGERAFAALRGLRPDAFDAVLATAHAVGALAAMGPAGRAG
jgi:transcriptional regulator with XRE-family HTH domain